ncbi:hypothetical protein [Streptomyces shenzhenensis]|uniref:Uncharacterized protein n=1 Tax=Streptomyces shenzhenensis TaxID=943815 RepID=A0A3M0I080_9ACTN|nr:hypothetical protein [Streptomyces shenzhenensis]RMB80103.1 hypothetical protein CTZ28_41875 [Streptomyces shenzhenensis]
MRRATALLAAALLLGGGTAGCSDSKSYDEIVKDCTQALKGRPEGEKTKPDACKGVHADDYDALLMSQVIDDLGWTDEDGNVDKNKMLDSLQP